MEEGMENDGRVMYGKRWEAVRFLQRWKTMGNDGRAQKQRWKTTVKGMETYGKHRFSEGLRGSRVARGAAKIEVGTAKEL